MAVELLGWRTLGTLLLAGLGAGILIVVAAVVTTSKDAQASEQELVKALAAALASAVTASMIKASESIDGPTADATKAAFQAKYEGVFAADSAGRRLVFDDGYANIWGWGRKAREQRADRVRQEYEKPNHGSRGDTKTPALTIRPPH